MAQFKLYLPFIKVNLVIHALGAKSGLFVVDRSPAGRVRWFQPSLQRHKARFRVDPWCILDLVESRDMLGGKLLNNISIEILVEDWNNLALDR